MQSLKNAESETLKLQSSFHENIILSIHPVLGMHIIPGFEQSMDEYKEIKLNYIFQNSRQGVENVLSGTADLAIVADAGSYPNMIKVKLWNEFIGLYSLDGKIKDTLLYHSQMISVQKILKKLEYKHLKKIDDYNILSLILAKGNYMALLPNPIAESYGLKFIREFKPEIQISAVYKPSRVKTKGFKKVVELLRG